MRHLPLLAFSLLLCAGPVPAKGHGGHGGSHGASGAVSTGHARDHTGGAVRAAGSATAGRTGSNGCLTRDERGNCAARDNGGAVREMRGGATPRFEEGGAFSGP